ncbi:hypothetical protein [Dongia sp. agr-C8]
MNDLITIGAYSIALNPILPWALLIALGVLYGGLILFALARRARGTTWRVVAGLLLVFALLDPSLVEEQRNYQKDIAVVLVDRSPSQNLGNRARETNDALNEVKRQLALLPDLEVRVIEGGGGPDTAEKGTELMGVLQRGLADVPLRRLAGVITISDGQVHDLPAIAADDANGQGGAKAALGFDAPIHLLMTGDPKRGDRRLMLTEAPSFGLVGKPVEMKFTVDDLGSDGGGTAQVTIRRDGQALPPVSVPVGQEQTLQLPLEHGGQTVFEITAEDGPQEITKANNTAVLSVNGVRDRLKVLLISGEPYPGERVWRNLLKSDPSVDLIHFTILRPPNKQDATPINELALISFPIDELFDTKLKQFDLIIFDRFQHLGILPEEYFFHIVDYVKNGGAVLESAGPSSAGQFSLYRTPLQEIFSAAPTGDIITRGYKPSLTELGKRHPVTADLIKNDSDQQKWGRWFRQIVATTRGGNTLMNGADGLPLLVLDRIGKGRVAELFSDQLWLWSKGFEGGGPQAELIRRIGHWLMQEPDLEEEDLRATVIDGKLEVQRRSLGAQPATVDATAPDGKVTKLKLGDIGHGKATAEMPAPDQGLYRVTDGQKEAFAASGALNSLEYRDPRASAEPMAQLISATGGGVQVYEAAGWPTLRQVSAKSERAGRGWFGLKQNQDYVVTGIDQSPLIPAWAALLLSLGAVLLAWKREGR